MADIKLYVADTSSSRDVSSINLFTNNASKLDVNDKVLSDARIHRRASQISTLLGELHKSPRRYFAKHPRELCKTPIEQLLREVPPGSFRKLCKAPLRGSPQAAPLRGSPQAAPLRGSPQAAPLRGSSQRSTHKGAFQRILGRNLHSAHGEASQRGTKEELSG